MNPLITKYFPNLTPEQSTRFDMLLPLYEEWNSKINVISRKDIGELYLHHVLHSLAIAKFVEEKKLEGWDGSTGAAPLRVLDVGTGGGFPGIPLAIMYPEIEFTLCDSIKKKILVVSEVTRALGLKNVTPVWARSETLTGPYDYIVSRAVTEIKEFLPLVRGLYTRGIIYLRGGDTAPYETRLITDWFPEDFFTEKKVVFISRS